MSTFYHENNIKIIKGDLSRIRSIDKNSIDLVITSPPYNLDIGYKNFMVVKLSVMYLYPICGLRGM